MTQPVSTADYVAAMGLHVASVCVITAAFDGRHYGLTATAVSSICADPPRILVCVNRSGVSHEKILAAKSFAVNVLAETQDKVAKAFAGMMGKDFEKFSIGDWQTLATGSPCLMDASAVFDCKLVQAIDQFTHTIFIGEVMAVASAPGRDPMLYGSRRFRTLRKVVTTPVLEEQESLHF